MPVPDLISYDSFSCLLHSNHKSRFVVPQTHHAISCCSSPQTSVFIKYFRYPSISTTNSLPPISDKSYHLSERKLAFFCSITMPLNLALVFLFFVIFITFKQPIICLFITCIFHSLSTPSMEWEESPYEQCVDMFYLLA